MVVRCCCRFALFSLTLFVREQRCMCADSHEQHTAQLQRVPGSTRITARFMGTARGRQAKNIGTTIASRASPFHCHQPCTQESS
uniref:Putative secreted protein n=1 Tax=Anopheles triannulatus TaxID=58253 RepID=A0A2M4B7H2_9DIPT